MVLARINNTSASIQEFEQRQRGKMLVYAKGIVAALLPDYVSIRVCARKKGAAARAAPHITKRRGVLRERQEVPVNHTRNQVRTSLPR